MINIARTHLRWSPPNWVLFHVPLLCFSMSCLSKQTSAHLTLPIRTPHIQCFPPVGEPLLSISTPTILIQGSSSHLLEGALPLASIFPQQPKSLLSADAIRVPPPSSVCWNTPVSPHSPRTKAQLLMVTYKPRHGSAPTPPSLSLLSAGSSPERSFFCFCCSLRTAILFTWDAPLLCLLGLQILLQVSTFKKNFFNLLAMLKVVF